MIQSLSSKAVELWPHLKGGLTDEWETSRAIIERSGYRYSPQAAIRSLVIYASLGIIECRYQQTARPKGKHKSESLKLRPLYRRKQQAQPARSTE